MFAALNEQDVLCRVFGDCLAGASYKVFKNGVLLGTFQASAQGNIVFSDVAGTLATVTFTVTAA